MKQMLFIVVALLCTLLNCAMSDVMRIDQTCRSEKKISQIKVLLEAPNQYYKTIAIIETSSGGWENVGLESLKNELVAQAAYLGGDAVIIGVQTNNNAGTLFTSFGNSLFASNVENKKLMGRVIVYIKQGDRRD